ncbi:MAG: adenine-specific methyltransferase EcoRI family protein [Bacteroidales bacterium]|nr:adenine-specific methyltransferase EcoRI family protein [Bacteroidales bacterium]MCD8394393.1 adenine-specific methyltransferase EcoRI family protein [Bacteroidales bacterium]
MPRKATNGSLHNAKAKKSDEFYTLYEDIEREVNHYKHLLHNKTIYCNCDNPEDSQFIQYFLNNFRKFGLKRVIGTCYNPQSYDIFNSTNAKGKYIDVNERNLDEILVDRTQFIKSLNGDGDFNSEECQTLLAQCDIVITNPPFSLFRKFLKLLVRFNKQFLVIGNINALTYHEVFHLIKNNEAWMGVNMGRGISGFRVPESYELFGTETHIDVEGNRIVSTNNCLWLTNLSTPLRQEFIPLNKVYYGNEEAYPKYDNYEAINVNKTQDIPQDYEGIVGVPITFLHKYNPQQFEIIQFRKGNDGRDLMINGKSPYFRILIRNKHPRSQKLCATTCDGVLPLFIS